MRVVALSGVAGAGKDVAAAYLCRKHGFVKRSFAEPMRAALNAMFGWLPVQWEDREWKERVQTDIGKSPRQLMQTLGTEWGRNLVNEDLWLILAQRAVEDARRFNQDGVVFTDCRFANEARQVRANGGEIWKLLRGEAAPVSAHVSEAGLPPHLVNRVISNNGSLLDLYDTLDYLVWAPR